MQLSCGQEYSAWGRIERITKLEPTDVGRINAYDFYVEVVGGNYKIRISIPEEKSKYYEYAVADGVMRSLVHIPAKPIIVVDGMHETNRQVIFPAQVEGRVIPRPEGTLAEYVWFAFASHSFFSTLTNQDQVMVPIWSPEDPQIRRQPFTMKVLYELLASAPGLPSRVDFLNDGYYRSYNPVTKAIDVIPLASPFDKGYTNAVYRVLTVTNIAGYSLPGRFVFTVYSSPIGANEISFERSVVWGKTEGVSDAAPEKADMRPFNGLASVVDYRLGGVVRLSGQSYPYKYCPYTVTNGLWPDSSQLPAIKERYEKSFIRKLKAKAITDAHNNGKRRFVLCVMALILVGPLILLSLQAMRLKASRHTKFEPEKTSSKSGVN